MVKIPERLWGLALFKAKNFGFFEAGSRCGRLLWTKC